MSESGFSPKPDDENGDEVLPPDRETSATPEFESQVAAEIHTFARRYCPETSEMAQVMKKIIRDRRAEDIRDYALMSEAQADAIRTQTDHAGRILLKMCIYCEIEDIDGWWDEVDSLRDIIDVLSRNKLSTPEEKQLVEEVSSRYSKWETALFG